MERHDPLSSNSCPEAASTPPTKRTRKLPPLLREVSRVKDDTLAFLCTGPDAPPGEYSRNLRRVLEIREQFTAFCRLNLHFSNWRQAWAAFFAHYQPITEVPPSSEQGKGTARPQWKQRLYEIARA